MPCVAGCLPDQQMARGPANCMIRIRSLYKGGFEFKIDTETTGNQCIKQALDKMGIPSEGACYFGLQYELYGEMCWIDNEKSIFGQLAVIAVPNVKPGEKRLFTILLRIRFFGIPEAFLDNDSFKNFLYYQLKTDFGDGKLTRNVSEVVSLSSYLLHIGSLTLIAYAKPGVEFEKKLVAVIPKQIFSVKKLVPYVQLGIKVIRSLTIDQTKMRFIIQCQLLPHYGAERFAAKTTPAMTPVFVSFSCVGFLSERSPSSSKHVLEWSLIKTVSVKRELLEIEFHPNINRRSCSFVFSSPDSAKRAYQTALMHQRLSVSKWKRPNQIFQPLVHVPRSLLQFDGESSKLSEAIKSVFALSSECLNHKNSSFEGYAENQVDTLAYNQFPFASDANIYGRLESHYDPDAFSLRSSAEESTLPLIYGSLLAQSTPILKRQPSIRTLPRANCNSAINLPHKKRLATSRPLLSSPTAMEQSVTIGHFSSQQSISHSDWVSAGTISRHSVALSHPHLTRNISEGDAVFSVLRTKRIYSDTSEPRLSLQIDQIGNSDRCSSLIFPRSISSENSADFNHTFEAPNGQSKYKSECALDKRNCFKTTRPPAICDLTESADDLTALPSFNNQTQTLPASFKTRRTSHVSRILCLELVQKLRDKQALEMEYLALPSLERHSPNGFIQVDLGLPVRYLVCPSLALEDLENEDFWANASNIIVLLDASSLVNQVNSKSGVVEFLHANEPTGDHITIGQGTYLSLSSVQRSSSSCTFGFHVKSPQHCKTVWLFCWLTQIVDSNVTQLFGPFVDEIVAADLSSCSSSSTFSTITVAATNSSVPLCSLYIVAHVLLRTLRMPTSNCPTSKSIFETVSAIRRFLPCTVVSLEEYTFLYELLLRWLEKPPRLI